MKTAYYRYNTSLGVGLNKVAGKVFRIGHLGALDEIMVGGVLFARRDGAASDCGVNVKLGSGTRRGGGVLQQDRDQARRPAAEPKLKLAS